MVLASGVLNDSMRSTTELKLTQLFSFFDACSQAYWKSGAVIGLPSLHLMSSRSVKVKVRPSLLILGISLAIERRGSATNSTLSQSMSIKLAHMSVAPSDHGVVNCCASGYGCRILGAPPSSDVRRIPPFVADGLGALAGAVGGAGAAGTVVGAGAAVVAAAAVVGAGW